MKYGRLGCILVALVAVLTMHVHLTVQAQTITNSRKHTRYILKDLGTFGGPNSYVSATPIPMNSVGTVVGLADTANPDPFAPNCFFDCFLVHTFQWRKGVLTDLGALADGGGSNPNGINAAGVIAGISENGVIDPQAEFPPEFEAVVWKDGQIINLGTLGGTFSYANSINDRNEVVGFALNGVPSSFFMDECEGGPMPTQMRAFIWQEGRGLHDLGTLGGPESCALWINQYGHVAGHSFTNSTPNSGTGIPTVDPFLWTNHEGMRDLGTLGGTFGHTSALNNRGQVCGDSNLAGDQTFHGFLWDKGKMKDLTPDREFSYAHDLNDNGEVIGSALSADGQSFNGFLWRHGVLTELESVAGDGCSFANRINSKGQIVGRSFSCAGDASHAFLSENGGPEIDLNTLVSPGSGLALTDALFINDRGEITGKAILPNGDEHAFLLIPKEQNDDDDAANATGATQADVAPVTTVPINITYSRLTREMRAMLRSRFSHRPRGLRAPLPK